MGELLTKSEMAERLRVSPATVVLWARAGRIPVLRINSRTYRYDEDAVLNSLRQVKTQGPERATA